MRDIESSTTYLGSVAVFGKRSREAEAKLFKLRALEELQRAFGNQMLFERVLQFQALRRSVIVLTSVG